MSCTWMPTKNGKTSNLIYKSLETGSLLLKKGEKYGRITDF
ncbi:unknown [Firmicutes bacterium CAG:646]|nr:unknown [Firmicutes bacterium CAG:646]